MPDGSICTIVSDNGFLMVSPAAVVSTAAGDTYTGYFIAAIARGADVQAAMKEASMASAISVTRNGASTSIPERKEVLESL